MGLCLAPQPAPPQQAANQKTATAARGTRPHACIECPALAYTCLQGDPIDALAEPPPLLDFARSRYGHATMLSERIGFLFEDVAATMSRAGSGEGGGGIAGPHMM